MQKIICYLKNRNIIIPIGLFIYLLFLLMTIFVPSLRLGNSTSFSLPFFYRGAVFLSFFIFVIFLYYKIHHSVNYVLWISVLIFFISNIFAIFLPFRDVMVPLGDKFMALLYLVSIIFTLFAFFEVFSSYFSKKSIVVFFVLIDVLMFVCCLYSLITEFSSIINAFIAKGEGAHFYQIHSFFDDKNSYGFMLFVALIGTLFIYHYFQKKIMLIPLIFFGINLVISRAKTALILAILLLVIYLLYKLVVSFRKHMVRNILIISALIFAIYFGLLIVFSEPIYSSSSFLSNLSNYVREAFIGQGIRSMTIRIDNLLKARLLFENPRIIIGYGEYVYRYANAKYISLGALDNVYVNIFYAGGIIKFLLFIYCYYLIFKNLVNVNKNYSVSKLYKIFLWSIVISLLIYGMMESYQILGSNHTSIIYLMLSYSVPYLFMKNNLGHVAS